MEHRGHDRAFAHSGCDAFDRSRTYVANGEDSGSSSCIGSVLSTSLATRENNPWLSRAMEGDKSSQFCPDHDWWGCGKEPRKFMEAW